MGAPRRGRHQLVALFAQQRPQLADKSQEIRVGQDPRPERTAVSVVIEFPDVDQLVERAHVPREIPHQFLRFIASY